MRRLHRPILIGPRSFIIHTAIFRAFISLCCVLLFASCSRFNGTPLEPIIGGDTNLISFSYRIADNLLYRASPPLVPQHPDMAILVSTLVDNNNLEETSKFGRVLQEHISSRLVQQGYTVREIKLSKTLSINPKSGETMLSRDLSQLSPDLKAQAVLVGTISRTGRVLYISSRLVNPMNKNIIATYDNRLVMGDKTLAMFGLQRQSDIATPVQDPGQPLLNKVL